MSANIVSIENKKAIVIFGSPHKNGHTRELMNKYINTLCDTDYTIFSVYDKNIVPCDDCGYCKTQDNCSKRDLDDFYELLEESDIVILATPIYNLGFPSPVKALIDRLQKYYHKQFTRKINPSIEKPKSAVVLLTSGSCDNNAENYCLIKKQLIRICSTINCKLQDIIWHGNTDKK